MTDLAQRLLTLVIGIGAVIILFLFYSYTNRKRPSGAETGAVLSPGPTKTPGASKEKNQESISPAIIAVITASICAMTVKSAEEFVFTAIRRVPGSHPVWAFVGTTEMMAARQRLMERGNRS
ncbi:hypothetical protein [Candidatus Formimonas warabiya]|uniref:Uncharacterized protein n=1 Tax=Formimonas warabiya TaxID=1761012 RepID=A0A3G1KZ44_FORW1|nr:hypothetical protein [Candidatus Formimonas warabiya]ATW27752.1 hypothetical protein DCMF_26040 [Candidatus Formimonas warabiya]